MLLSVIAMSVFFLVLRPFFLRFLSPSFFTAHAVTAGVAFHSLSHGFMPHRASCIPTGAIFCPPAVSHP